MEHHIQPSVRTNQRNHKTFSYRDPLQAQKGGLPPDPFPLLFNQHNSPSILLETVQPLYSYGYIATKTIQQNLQELLGGNKEIFQTNLSQRLVQKHQLVSSPSLATPQHMYLHLPVLRTIKPRTYQPIQYQNSVAQPQCQQGNLFNPARVTCP